MEYTKRSGIEGTVAKYICDQAGNTEVTCTGCAKAANEEWVHTMCPFLKITMFIFAHIRKDSKKELESLLGSEMTEKVFTIIQGQTNPVKVAMNAPTISEDELVDQLKEMASDPKKREELESSLQNLKNDINYQLNDYVKNKVNKNPIVKDTIIEALNNGHNNRS